MATSKASARWEGSLKDGRGQMKPAHASEIPFTVNTRFEGAAGSNPEELIGAALAGCFSMALAASLGKAGLQPSEINTSADVQLDKEADGFRITQIALTTRGERPRRRRGQVPGDRRRDQEGLPRLEGARRHADHAEGELGVAPYIQSRVRK